MNDNFDYSQIPLTDEELSEAILDGKRKKFFHERNKEHWIQEELDALEREKQAKEEARRKRLNQKI